MSGRPPREGATSRKISVEVPIELYDRLAHCAAEDDRPLPLYLRRLLREHADYAEGSE